MNKIFYYSFFIFFILFFKNNLAQTFWTESFGTGCTSGNVASTGVPTASNGAWVITNLAALPGNGANANEWFISATEAGMGVSNCGDGCLANVGLTNRTLHIGANLFPFFVDPGAAYLAGAPNFNTNKRAESPTINCTGQIGISLSLSYLMQGIAAIDFAEVLYSANNGVTWAVLSTPAITSNLASCTGTAAGQGFWTNLTVALPASANNNPIVKVGFRWQSSDPLGADPSIAVDDVILFKPLATLSVTTSSTVCSNQNIAATLTGTTAGTTAFTWSTVPGGATISGTTALGTTANINYPTAGVYTLAVGGFVGAAITYTAIQTVTVTGTPTVTVVPASQTICVGNTATLTANAIGGPTLQWASGTFPLITLLGTALTQTVAPAINTTYTIIAGVGSCTAFATTNVVIGSGLTLTGNATPTAACAGGAVTLSVTGASSYTWVAPPTTTLVGNTSSQIVNPVVATTYTVFGDNAGCTGSTTIPVGISAGLTLTLTASSATTCPGQPVTLTASGAVNYTWSPASSLSSTNGTTVTATPTIATTYTVVGDNGAGCTGTSSITITLGSGGAVSVLATATAVCSGFNATLTAVGATSYTWTGTGIGVPINQPSISVASGVYNYTASGASGCIIIGSIPIATLAPLVITILTSPSSGTTCMASNFPPYSKAVCLTASGASTYFWSVYVPSIITNSIGPNVCVRPPTSTCYTVTGNTSVCSGYAVVCVTVVPQFTMSIIPKQPIMCIGDTLGLSVANIGTLATLPITNYIWYDPLPPSISNPFDPTVTITPSATCTYSVEIFDNKACVSLPRLVTVTVLPQPLTAIAIPTINGLATNTVCFVGDRPGALDVNLILTSSNLNILIPGVVPTFTWIPPYTTPFSPILTPNPINGSPGSIIVSAPSLYTSTPTFTSNISPPHIQTYTVISGYNGIPGCTRKDTVSVIAVDCRSVTISSVLFTTATENDTICSRQCVTFLNQSDTASGGPQTYTWTFSGGSPTQSNLKNPTICYNLPGVYWVRLQVRNPYALPGGSQAAIAKNGYIRVVDIPNTTIVPPGQLASNVTIRFGGTDTLIGSGAKSYIWSPNYRISSLTSPTVYVNPLKTTQYIVTGYNSKLCFSSDTVNVIVIEDCGEMYVPNAFSPNGDGTNDILYVRGVCLESLNFMVFNRWGEKVFETTDIKKGWDGTYKGDIMNTSVFVYRLEGKTYDGKGFSSKGNVTLIR